MWEALGSTPAITWVPQEWPRIATGSGPETKPHAAAPHIYKLGVTSISKDKTNFQED